MRAPARRSSRARCEIDQAQVEQRAAPARLRAASTSPIDGVTGVRLVDAGQRRARASDPSGHRRDHRSSIRSRCCSRCRRTSCRASPRRSRAATLPVEVWSRDGSTRARRPASSRCIDNQINQATATLRLKALVPEPGARAVAERSSSRRGCSLETRKGALVVPAAAVQRGPAGHVRLRRRRGQDGAAAAGRASRRIARRRSAIDRRAALDGGRAGRHRRAEPAAARAAGVVPRAARPRARPGPQPTAQRRA